MGTNHGLAKPDRRLVLITGAGASRNLGKGGPLPLMGDWARILSGDLGADAKAIGLSPQISGEAFEKLVGSFLKWSQGHDLNGRFGRLIPFYGDVAEWAMKCQRKTDEMVNIIRTSVFREFSKVRLDERAVENAYGKLFAHLDIKRGELVCATTNYDPSLRLALRRRDLNPAIGDDGEPGSTAMLRIVDLVDWDVRHRNCTPMLHLHGMVGWYWKGNEIQVLPDDQEFVPALGAPAVMLPDPQKDPFVVDVIRELWSNLRAALDDATHVLVLGHSLHDPHLADELRRSEGATICVAAPKDCVQDVARSIEGAVALPMEFGPNFEIEAGLLESWSQPR